MRAVPDRIDILISTRCDLLQAVKTIEDILAVPGGILLLELFQCELAFLPEPISRGTGYELTLHLRKTGLIQNLSKCHFFSEFQICLLTHKILL